MKHTMKLHPFWECGKAAMELMDKGATIYQQFNCAQCRRKQTMETPNAFFQKGICEECGHETDIEKDGCNYAVHFQIGGKQ